MGERTREAERSDPAVIGNEAEGGGMGEAELLAYADGLLAFVDAHPAELAALQPLIDKAQRIREGLVRGGRKRPRALREHPLADAAGVGPPPEPMGLVGPDVTHAVVREPVDEPERETGR